MGQVFKAGDRVRVVDASGARDARVGDVLTVGPAVSGSLIVGYRDRDGRALIMFPHRVERVAESYSLRDGDGDWWAWDADRNRWVGVAGTIGESDRTGATGFEDGIRGIKDDYGIKADGKPVRRWTQAPPATEPVEAPKRYIWDLVVTTQRYRTVDRSAAGGGSVEVTMVGTSFSDVRDAALELLPTNIEAGTSSTREVFVLRVREVGV